MLSAHQLLEEIIAALRNVIAPAIPAPYPKAQAYMAAVILEFVSRQVEERRDLATEKAQAVAALWGDLPAVLAGQALPAGDDGGQEARLCRLIEWVYTEKDQLGPGVFTTANRRIREALRHLLDEELKIAGKAE